MKQIDIGLGLFTLVDDDDYEWLNDLHGWHCSSNGYVMLKQQKDWKVFQKAMHKLIMLPPDGMLIDHKDGNRLNNQRHNLRVVTRSQNRMNSKKHKAATSSSHYKGVSREAYPTSKHIYTYWRSTITLEGSVHILGYFKNELHAAMAYDIAARDLFGEYAYLNFPTALPHI